MAAAAPTSRQKLAVALAALILALGLAGFALGISSAFTSTLMAALAALSVASSVFRAEYTSNTLITPGFTIAMLAIAFLGPSEAFAIALIGEAANWVRDRYRWRALLINLAGVGTPTLIVGEAFHLVDPSEGSAAFYAALAVGALIVFSLNSLVVVSLMNLLDDHRPVLPRPETEIELLPSVLISGGLALVFAAAYIEWGLPALGIAVLMIAAIAYMDHLVAQSRLQTRQYANLSWGVLSGLVRTLNERDHRASRHCAAVAMFSRDIAELCGFDQHDQELAHTAGLLHDIGKFTLSDRVMERGAQLEESDWRGIRRHPDIGADLLKDIGVFGPVGEIVRCHHERLDGRGYPRGLTSEEIPEVAKIVAVAEVYDTLTAPDTYRTPMNSFEALNELRRVSGSQLDGRYVDALAKLLAGRGTDYRHQDEADFDRELDMERRMSEAATPA